jgi:hypothetical protein
MITVFDVGLPGSGAKPVHLHAGNPTPWSEGCVVRFLPECGPAWIGNLQKGYGYSKKIVFWDEAHAFIVIANGATYLVWADQSEKWRFFDLLGIDCVIDPTGKTAILSTYTDVVAISVDGTEKWRRTIAADGVEVVQIENGVIHGKAGIDPPDEWHPFWLRLNDGEQIEPGAG